jgi:hypothetical protein
MSQSAFSIDSLKCFTGSEEWFRHALNRRMIYTEGVMYLAESAHCHWLVTDIAVKYFPILMKKYPDHFYLIEFIATSDNRGSVIISDGNDNVHFKDKISYTDFPVKDAPIKLYLTKGDGHYCLMLQSEY